MVDYFKINLPKGYQSKIRNHPDLNFSVWVNPDTGEVVATKEVAYYKDLKFIVHSSGRVVIDGSLHKYWNNGEHNFNDFSLFDCGTELLEFLNRFDIDPNDAKLNRLEIGLNFQVPYPIRLITQNLFIHKGVPFKWTHTKSEGHYYQADHKNYYRVKIYDKSKQYQDFYSFEEELLRFEIHYCRKKLLREFALDTVQDLIQIPFKVFIDSLVNELKSSLFYDFTIEKETKTLLKYANKNFWKNLIENKQKSTYYKHRNRLDELTNIHSKNVLDQLVEIVRSKGLKLTQGGEPITNLCILGISTPLEGEKVCLVTGFGISMQRSDSRFLSIKGLKFYRTFNFKAFESIRMKYLPGKWRDASENIQIERVAQNIRNTFNNSMYRRVENQLEMF